MGMRVSTLAKKVGLQADAALRALKDRGYIASTASSPHSIVSLIYVEEFLRECGVAVERPAEKSKKVEAVVVPPKPKPRVVGPFIGGGWHGARRKRRNAFQEHHGFDSYPG